MPAIVKASSKVLAGGFALIRYSVTQTSELLLTVEAEFVGLPTAPDNLFKIGSPPPSVLLDSAGFVTTLQTYGSPSIPSLVDAEIIRSNGLKTISATYAARIAPTKGGSVIRISTDENGNVLLTTDGATEAIGTVGGAGATGAIGTVGGAGATGAIGTVGGAGATGAGQDLINGVLAPGSAFSETTISTNWQSISGSYDLNGESNSWSADYLSISVTFTTTGGGSFIATEAARVSSVSNVKGILPDSLAPTTRTTQRTYANSRGESRYEFTSIGVLTY